MEESVLDEEVIADVVVRYLEAERDGEPHFYAAGAPLDDEWCFLARAERLDELQIAARAIVEQPETFEIFRRCAALMGVAWTEGSMLPLLEAQDRNGRELMRKAPRTAQADVEALRRIRRRSADDVASEN